MTHEGPTLQERATTYKTTLIAAGIAAVGLFLLWVSGWAVLSDHDSTRSLVNELGGLLITTGGLAVLWDLRGKRDLMQEVLAKVKISSDVQSSGITQVTMNWLEIPWDALFASSRQIDVFISYGTSWRNVHWPKLQAFAAKSGNSFRLYLPDPNDEATMAVLAKRYAFTVEKIKSNVEEMAREIASLSTPQSADIRIYYRAGDPTYTCYRFDDQILVTLYSNKRERGDVPALLVRGGTFHEFFTKDFEAIRTQSTAVPLTSLAGGAST